MNCLKAILFRSIAFVYNNIENIILSFIVDSITYKKPHFYHKKNGSDG